MRSDAIGLPAAELERYLSAHVAGFAGLKQIEKFSGGQSNPTFRLEADSGTYVLRRQPPGKLLKSAHAVDREFRVMRALAGTAVPVPEALHLCEDPEVLGALFFVMRYCPGPIHWKAALPGLEPAQRAHCYDEMNRVLAELHALDPATLGLADYGKPGSYFARQLGRWTSQYRASEINPIPEMDQLISWLEERLPDDDGRVALVHGDYRLDNFIWDADSQRIVAVLDWELSTLGHPFADLAYQCMQLRLPDLGGSIVGLQGLDRQALGIPDEARYVERYCERRGLDGMDDWPFYLGFSFFRLGAIAQGVAKRAQQGNASSAEASKVGAMVQPLAQLALASIHAA